jgi:hypothetical protein
MPNRIWDRVGQDFVLLAKEGYYDLTQHKLQFKIECLKLLDHREQPEAQLFQIQARCMHLLHNLRQEGSRKSGGIGTS